ncbi:hypothetical protein Tco_0862444 [Tanacetum coccineum]
MTTLAKNVIVVRANNHPPMLDKSMYNSWKSRMILYIKGKEHGRIILNSILNGPIVYETIEVDSVTRTKTDEELSDKEKLQDDCDVRATNIVLQGLPPDVYSLVNHHDVAKDIWDRIRLLMQGTELSKQEHECKLYNEFDRFTSVKGESLHEYYLSHQPEWSKFVTDVKLARNMHTTNYDQLYAYLSQHKVHANEVRQMRERFSYPLALVGDDPIASLNKAMAFLSITIASRYPTTNNQLRTSSNPRNQATIQDGRVTVQQGEGHMARQCTQPKRLRNAEWFKEKILLTDDLDAFDSDCDEAPGAKAVLMANLSSYDSDAISETKSVVVQNTTSTEQQNAMLMSVVDEITNQVALVKAVNLEHKTVNETLTAELERYKEQIKQFEDRQNVDLNDREKYIDS